MLKRVSLFINLPNDALLCMTDSIKIALSIEGLIDDGKARLILL